MEGDARRMTALIFDIFVFIIVIAFAVLMACGVVFAVIYTAKYVHAEIEVWKEKHESDIDD
jgi:uncharacterized membrane protein YqiK